MIIDKVEKNGIVDAIYESSNIIASQYNQSDKTLNIIFKQGGSYLYSNDNNCKAYKYSILLYQALSNISIIRPQSLKVF